MSYVYFIRADVVGYIKIGTAIDPWDRMSGLGCLSPVLLEPLALMHGGRPVERQLHNRFAHLRVRGEWFRPEPELLEFIRDQAFPWPSKKSDPMKCDWERMVAEGVVQGRYQPKSSEQDTLIYGWRMDCVLRWHDEGLNLEEIAARMDYSVETVDLYLGVALRRRERVSS